MEGPPKCFMALGEIPSVLASMGPLPSLEAFTALFVHVKEMSIYLFTYFRLGASLLI